MAPLPVPPFETIRFGRPLPPDAAAALRRNALFAGLAPEALRTLPPLFRWAVVPAGTVLFAPETVASTFYVLLHGTLVHERPGAPVPDVRDATMFAGEDALFRRIHTVRAYASAPLRFAWIEGDRLEALMRRQPVVALNVLRFFARRFDALGASFG